jgi:hypothetical protein
MTRFFLRLLFFALFCYAIFGRGFAYVSIPPVFISELILALGILTVLVVPRFFGTLLNFPRLFPLYLFMIWGMLRTFPYIGEYGIDALRDGVLWAYAAFAYIVYSIAVGSPSEIQRFVSAYRIFAQAFPFVIAPIVIASLLGVTFPSWPDSGIQMVSPRPGAIGVHLAGVIAFYSMALTREKSVIWLLCTLLAFFSIAAGNRGALISVLIPLLFLFLVRRSHGKRLIRWFRWAFAAVLIGFMASPSIVLFQGRQLTSQQIVENLLSIVSENPEDVGMTASTRLWRLLWWTDIVDYTIFGEYFWYGKGYGINLSEDDKYPSIDPGPPLRSPHNAHMNLLARSGVPGFILWIILQTWWVLKMVKCYRRAQSLNQDFQSGVFMFLLAYWMAFMINSSVDVFLEGPMGGIWFWVVFGTGLAFARLYEDRSLPPMSLSPDSKKITPKQNR